MHVLHVILDGYRDPLYNMALDESILSAVNLGYVSGPYLRIYMWRPTGVSIGRGQSFRDTLNLDNVFRYGYIPVRRPTGGGALIHMEGMEITYSVVLDSSDRLFHMDVSSSSIEIARGVAYALQSLNVDASLPGEYMSRGEPLCYFRRGSSDILIGGRKISGSAQYRLSNALLQHGTLLIDFNPDPWVKCIKGVDRNSLSNKVTSLKDLGVDTSISELIESLLNGFLKALGIRDYRLSSFTPYILELADKLYSEKYLHELKSLGFPG